MAEALISVLLEQLASIIQKQVEQEVTLIVGVEKEVAKLSHNFKAIQVVLEDAEERQVKELNVKYWLERLKDVSYEMDDVLDEWSTEILKQQIQKQEAGNAGSTSTTKKHLHVLWCRSLKFLKGIARLTSLRTLDEVHIHGDDDVDNNKEALFELSDLRNMDQLRGSFYILFGTNLKDVRQAVKAHLVNKNCLVNLELSFFLDTWQPEPIQEETMNALQPPPNLESLSINIYRGTRLRPHWMTSLNKLRSLTLQYCMVVEFVPPLGRLESLEVLVIVKWDRLKKVGVEFLGIDGTIETQTSLSPLILFPSLKRLEFEFMCMWEEWEGMTGWSEEEDSQKTITIMPCLSSLRIIDCHVLKTLPNFLRNTPLKELVIEGGVMFDFLAPVAQGCRKGRGEWPKISHIPNIKLGKEFVQKDGVYQIDDDEMPSVASTSSSGYKFSMCRRPPFPNSS
ncbi:putative disease resistance protein At3g14460 isoform X2 [Prunus persica]|uniref:putative disease resistance protein At3g14460 isoform X2 n=1 Tax=Prunus persica TaxID=3760 RepID=UPI0009AB3C7C|nr:putative disease resistance protein At3g14460 isoform X2 [Prunus persica]